MNPIRRFFSGYYNALLICLVLLFIFRPYSRDFAYLAVWKCVLTIAFLSAIFNCKHHKTVKWTTFFLAIPTIIISWTHLWINKEIFSVADAFLTAIFTLITTASILTDVVIRARVTVETLRGVICAYFMVAFAFAYTYYLIDYFVPGTFIITGREVPITNYIHYLSEMLYFSFNTLLTIGFGDIIAALDIGQTAIIIEGIIGQFYIAILVARIVSVYSSYSDKKLLHNIEKDISKLKDH